MTARNPFDAAQDELALHINNIKCAINNAITQRINKLFTTMNITTTSMEYERFRKYITSLGDANLTKIVNRGGTNSIDLAMLHIDDFDALGTLLDAVKYPDMVGLSLAIVKRYNGEGAEIDRASADVAPRLRQLIGDGCANVVRECRRGGADRNAAFHKLKQMGGTVDVWACGLPKKDQYDLLLRMNSIANAINLASNFKASMYHLTQAHHGATNPDNPRICSLARTFINNEWLFECLHASIKRYEEQQREIAAREELKARAEREKKEPPVLWQHPAPNADGSQTIKDGERFTTNRARIFQLNDGEWIFGCHTDLGSSFGYIALNDGTVAKIKVTNETELLQPVIIFKDRADAEALAGTLQNMYKRCSTWINGTSKNTNTR